MAIKKTVKRYLKQGSTWVGIIGLLALLLFANHNDPGSVDDVLKSIAGMGCLWQLLLDGDKTNKE
jgi:hypothetical protein